MSKRLIPQLKIGGRALVCFWAGSQVRKRCEEGKNRNGSVRKTVAGVGGCNLCLTRNCVTGPFVSGLSSATWPLPPFLSARARTLSDTAGTLESVTFQRTRSSLRAGGTSVVVGEKKRRRVRGKKKDSGWRNIPGPGSKEIGKREI